MMVRMSSYKNKWTLDDDSVDKAKKYLKVKDKRVSVG